MERQLGRALFDRIARRLVLNEHGRRLLPLAQELLMRFEELGRVAATPDELAGDLRIGTSNTVGNYLVGDLVGGFIQTHPRVNVRLNVENTATIVQRLLDCDVDVGCVEGDVTHPDVVRHPWREDRLCLCAPIGHPLARRRRLRPDDFADVRWILRERGSATRTQTERVLAALPSGQVVLELDQAEAIKQAVIAGLGLALLPVVAVAHEQAAGRLAVLKTPFLPLQRTLDLVMHRHRWRGPLLEAFLASATLRPQVTPTLDHYNSRKRTR
jgi:DNA-binding transcriptional LysR family regulator